MTFISSVSYPIQNTGQIAVRVLITYTSTVDTGSSDTWVPTAGFICLDVDGASIAESECGFGSTYNATIPYNETILDEFFFIIYGDGEYAYGTLSVSQTGAEAAMTLADNTI